MWHIPLPRIGVLVLTLIVISAALLLHQSGMSGHAMAMDDFPLVYDSMNWGRTQQSLWQPYQNHLFPLYRLLTFALVSSAGCLSDVPTYLFFGWMVSLAIALLVFYEFVSRETGSEALGWTAILLSGMTSVYHTTAGLYGTAQIFWAISFLLIALLFLQSMRDNFRWGALIVATVMAMLAPAWRTEGLLVGPVASLYAVFSTVSGMRPRHRLWMALGPSLGTCSFVGLALWMCGSELIRSPGTYEGSSLVTFNPLMGAYMTARMSTEHLLVWNLGFRNELPLEQFIVLCAVMVSVSAYWLRRAGFSALTICGLSLVLFSYLLVYTIRGQEKVSGTFS